MNVWLGELSCFFIGAVIRELTADSFLNRNLNWSASLIILSAPSLLSSAFLKAILFCITDLTYSTTTLRRAALVISWKNPRQTHQKPSHTISSSGSQLRLASAAIPPGWRASWSCWNHWNNPRRSHRWCPQRVIQPTTSWSAAHLSDAG